MNGCRQYNYKDIIKVEFFADNDNVISFIKPFAVYDPVITCASAENSNSISTGCVLKMRAEDRVQDDSVFFALIEDMTGSLTIKETISVAGRKHTCTLSYQLKRDVPNEWRKQLMLLKNANHHVLITYLGGSQHLIRSIPESWMVSANENEGKITVTVTVENISGAQQIIQ